VSYLLESRKIQSYVFHVNTSTAKEIIGTTDEIYPNTDVTYTPPSGAQKVVYQVDYQIAWNPEEHASWSASKLQYSTDGGTNWTDVTGTLAMEGNYSTADDFNWHLCTRTHIMDTWSGERKFRIAGRAYNASSTYTVGRGYQTIPSNSELTGSCPHVSIYAVM
jgi:hypothetical protein